MSLQDTRPLKIRFVVKIKNTFFLPTQIFRMTSSYKSWCFTINNVAALYNSSSDDPAQHFAETFSSFLCFPERRVQFSYACYQLETAPTTGTLHCQGYIYFKTNRRMGWVKQWLGELGFQYTINRPLYPHVERAKGTAGQNRDYCSKDDSAVAGTFRELGEIPRQGNRSDLAELAQAIAEGDDISDIAAKFPTEYIRYNRGIQALKIALSTKPRSTREAPTVCWWFGPTGTGKSRLAFESYPNAYIKMPTNKWWDGYVDQVEVILDDYRPSMCPFHELLRLLDRYPMKVEFKGGSTELQATTFIITTCERPELIWQGKTDEMIDQLLRRLSEIKQFNPDGTTTILKDSVTCYVKAPVPESSFVSTFNR